MARRPTLKEALDSLEQIDYKDKLADRRARTLLRALLMGISKDTYLTITDSRWWPEWDSDCRSWHGHLGGGPSGNGKTAG